MQELLLVNPRKRAKSRKHRTAAQKAATRRLVAMNKGRSANPKRRKSAKRRVRRVAHAAVRHHNPAPRRTHRRARRRNPISLSKPMGILHPALIGALGATAVNTVFSQVGGMLPTVLTTGNAAYLTKGVLAFGLAMISDKLGMKGAMVNQMAEGSLTVTLHDAILSLANSAGITQLSGMGAYMPRQSIAYRPQVQALPRPAHLNLGQLLPAQRQKVSGFGF